MKTSYTHQIYMGTLGDMKNLEQHYSDMAEKGWMIDKIGAFTHRYRAVEPGKKRFFVDFLPQITAFDYPENEDAQDYRRICEESGWNFIAANKQFHIFCADGETPAPVPIHTDNSVQAKIYLRACRKYELPMLLVAILMLWFFSPMGRGVELFLSNILLFTAIGYFCFLIGFAWTFGFVGQWYIRTKNSAKRNLPMPRVNRRLANIRSKVFAAGAVAYLACIITGVVLEVIGGMPLEIGLIAIAPLLAVFVGLGIRRRIDTKKRTRAGNIRLTVIVLVVMEIFLIGGTALAVMRMPFSHNADSLGNRPALTVKDVGATAPASRSDIRVNGTPVVPVDYEYWESSREGSVRTQIHCSVNITLTKLLYDSFAKDFERQFSYALADTPDSIAVLTSDEAAFWGAENGMALDLANNTDIELLLRNGKTILRISASGNNMNLETVIKAVQRLWKDSE